MPLAQGLSETTHMADAKAFIADTDAAYYTKTRLLLLNERDEWDLPGGRPDVGEDHRARGPASFQSPL